VNQPVIQRLGVAALLALLFCSAVGSVPRADAISVLPTLDKPTATRMSATLRRGEARGNRPDVFAKVGDSISQSPAFLQSLGCGQWQPRANRRVRSAVESFTARSLPGASSDCVPVNSFSRNSAATFRFTLSDWPLVPGASPDPACRVTETPLACEVRLIRPGFAVILFGTNDVTVGLAFGSDPYMNFMENMGRLVAATRRLGVVPILTTIPPRMDGSAEATTEELNTGLAGLAAQRHVPLIDLWRAFVRLPNRGLSADDVHPSLYGGPGCVALCDPKSCAPGCQAANFTAAGLQYGYDTRNLITLQTLRRLSAFAQRLKPR
jgi:hypothetical protein